MNEVRFSIVVHALNTDPELFKKMLLSVDAINYMNFELIVIDSNPVTILSALINEVLPRDGRVIYKKTQRELNNAEALNVGLRQMSGDYLCILGQYDEVAYDWLERMEKICISSLIPAKKELDFDDLTKAASGGRLRQWKLTAPDVIYTDHDEIIDDTRMNPHFVGDFNPELLLQYDYMGKGIAISIELLRKLRFFDESLEYGELYEYKLRILEYYMTVTNKRYPSHSLNIRHCPGLLYHEKIRSADTVMHRTIAKMSYEAECNILKDYLARNHIEARINRDRSYKIHPVKRKGSDYLVKKREYIILRDKGLRIAGLGSLTAKMYAHMKQWDVAVVGGRFVNAGKILNCGYIYDRDGIIYPACAGADSAGPGYEYRISLAQDVSMVDPDFCMIDAAVYKRLGGLRAGMLKRDAMLDFCLRVRASGYRVVYDPDILIRKPDQRPESSKSSHDVLMSLYGPDGSSEKIRLENGDPFYNPNLPIGVENYVI